MKIVFNKFYVILFCGNLCDFGWFCAKKTVKLLWLENCFNFPLIRRNLTEISHFSTVVSTLIPSIAQIESPKNRPHFVCWINISKSSCNRNFKQSLHNQRGIINYTETKNTWINRDNLKRKLNFPFISSGICTIM